MNRRQKFLFVQNYWTPYRHELFNALSKDIDISVLYLGEIEKERKWKEDNSTNYKSIRVSSKKVGPFTFSKIDDLDFSQYDLVVLIEHLENIFSVLNIARKVRHNYIIWSEMSEDMYPDKPVHGVMVELFKKLYRPIFYKARYYFAFSSMTKEMFVKWGIDEDDITTIPQAAHIEEITELRDKTLEELRGGRSGPLRVLSLSYLRPGKNNLSLVKVCSRFRKNEVHLRIVGDGSERDILESMAADNTEFVGYKDGEEKYKEYLWADVFVLSTIRDAWGLTVNEAMHYGLPVICSNRAGAKDAIIDNGFVYDPFDNDTLYELLLKFINNRELIVKMGQKSVQIEKDYYSIDRAADLIHKTITALKSNHAE